MTKLCSLMIDCSRDSSNKNELLVASTFYDDNKNEIKRILFKIIKQNQTKSQVLYQTIANLLKENNISFRAIVAVMTDNANEMCGDEGGLTTLMKLKNNSIYSVTCICHSLNLVLKHLMIWLKENDLEIAPEIVEVGYFLSSITSMFHYSFQKEAEYKQFREEFLKTKKNE